MRAIGIAPVSFMVATLMVSDADAASNRWCAYSPKRSEQLCHARSVPSPGAGARGLVPTESVPWDGVWDQWHLVGRSTAANAGPD